MLYIDVDRYGSQTKSVALWYMGTVTDNVKGDRENGARARVCEYVCPRARACVGGRVRVVRGSIIPAP